MRLTEMIGTWVLLLVFNALSPAKAGQDCQLSDVHQQVMTLQPGLVPSFEQYAIGQGYLSDCSKKVVALHEMLHLVGVQNDGFVFESELYQPRFVPLWQSVIFAEVVAVIRSNPGHSGLKRSKLFQDFLVRNPESTLDVLLDEIVVHAQTYPYIKHDAAASHYKKRLNEHRQAFLVGWGLLDDQARRVAADQYRDLFNKIELNLEV